MDNEFTIVIDTRERRKWSFPEHIPTITKTLLTGDYSILGLEDRITVERKSLTDLYGTVGRGRERFEKELERMRSFDYAEIVIEATWARIAFRPPKRTKLSPKTVLGSLNSFKQRYGVHVTAAGDRASAQWLCLDMLQKFYRDVKDGKR